MGRKIAIVGTTTSLVDAPYDDETWELWGLNGAYKAMRRWDRWFDMHDLSILKKYHDPAYFDFLAKAGDKLTMNNEYDEYPEAGVFPFQELVDKYGRYFSNTISWLIAYALEQDDVEEIGLWGVNMAQDTEYAKQRPSCEYFLGIAVGRDIKITIPEASEMLKTTHLYGWEPTPSFIAKIPDKQRELKLNHEDVLRNLESSKGKLHHVNGYLQGMAETYDFMKSAKKKDVEGYMNGKRAECQHEAKMLDRETNQLLDKKAYWQGATDLMQYYVVNW
jgi:hypothetical protein